MKTLKSIFSLLAWLCLIPMQAQTVDKEALYIYQTDGRANIFFRNEVTTISLEMKDGVMHQVVYTGNKPHYFAVSKIQSMSFVHPEEDTYRPLIIGDEDSPTFGKAIDLGLPSGTKWASCNVGASSPEEYGGYYAWGETEEKDYYAPSTYQHACKGGDGLHNLHDEITGDWYTLNNLFIWNGSDISGTQYDVAHVKWGDKWCLPTREQQIELEKECSFKWITYYGVNGGLFVGPNGNSIFLPVAGWKGSLHEGFGYFLRDENIGYYWSSYEGGALYYFEAFFLSITNKGGFANHHIEPCSGLCVRPVVK